MRRLVVLGLTLVLLMSLVGAANAGITVYTDKTAWETDLGKPFLTENFDDYLLNDGVSFVSTEFRPHKSRT